MIVQKHKRPVKTLVKYSLDIASGMLYLSEKGLVHRVCDSFICVSNIIQHFRIIFFIQDLAARNIMLNKDEMCKIGDFGLLREVSTDDDPYVSSTDDNLTPIRWMAPESLTYKIFSAASDVWSFGVIMWEMMNPEELPYTDLTNMDVIIGVCMGSLSLDIPGSYPSSSASVMKACLQHEPSKRPTFSQIALLLSVTLELVN